MSAFVRIEFDEYAFMCTLIECIYMSAYRVHMSAFVRIEFDEYAFMCTLIECIRVHIECDRVHIECIRVRACMRV